MTHCAHRTASLLGLSLVLALTGCATQTTKDGAPDVPASVATPGANAKKPLRTQLVNVIDANTIEVRPVSEKNGQPTGEPSLKVRMLGVTAPEASACGGAESIAQLKSLFRPNEPVTVTYEPTLTSTTDKDGNTLAYVITGAGVTQDIGYRMVQEGFAAAVYPEGQTAPKDFAQYRSVGKGAIDQKRGIWATCPAPRA